MPVGATGGGFAATGLMQAQHAEQGQGSNPGTSPPSPEGSSKSSTPVRTGRKMALLPEYKTAPF